jgi:hypothetical protein
MSALIHAFADQFITIVAWIYSAVTILLMGGVIVAAIVSPIVRLLRAIRRTITGTGTSL